MPAIKRKRGVVTAGVAPKKRKYMRTPPFTLLPQAISRMVDKKLNKNIETKTACSTSADGAQIFHNNFITRSTNLLWTTQGVGDPKNINTSCRVGDQINLSGVSIKMNPKP
jgi:hypothetical protein